MDPLLVPFSGPLFGPGLHFLKEILSMFCIYFNPWIFGTSCLEGGGISNRTDAIAIIPIKNTPPSRVNWELPKTSK